MVLANQTRTRHYIVMSISQLARCRPTASGAVSPIRPGCRTFSGVAPPTFEHDLSGAHKKDQAGTFLVRAVHDKARSWQWVTEPL